MKVFGIGFHKTGTTTLTTCLRYLGFSICDEEVAYQARASVAAKEYFQCLRIASKYEAFADSPWCYRDVYKVLDLVFPDSQFVLTVRNADEWFESLIRWVDYTEAWQDLSFFQTVGCAVLRERATEIKFAYMRHNAEVQQHFSGRPRKLLVLDWKNDGWKPLCDFLTKPIPQIPVPRMLRYDSDAGSYVNENVPVGSLEDEMKGWKRERLSTT